MIFQPAKATSAFLKMGLMGKQGAGKSKTAAKTAIGLINYMKAKGIDYASKPVAFFDTETGSDWLIPDFEKAGIPLVVAKKRTFAELLEAVKWAEANASVLIIDSITHPWRELLESFMKKKQRTYLQIDDWSYLKGDYGWAQFTDRYINSKLHIIMCGRAGDDLEQYTDEQGKRQLEKVGVKMKTEGETGFEPSLLVLMERDMNTRTNQVTHRATILKDRSDRLDGEEFDDPDFKDFLPHIELLNLGGDHIGVDVGGGDSQHILKTEKRDWQPVQRKIVLGEIQDLLTLHYAGMKAEDKTARIKALLKHFDAGWTEIEEVMPLPTLREGYDRMYRELEGKPSKYAVVAAETADAGEKAEIGDELPAHSAPAAQTNGNGLSLKDKLLADIPNNKSIGDCLKWALQVSADFHHKLTEAERNEINNALLAHQAKLAKAGETEGGAGQDGTGDKPSAEKPARTRKRADEAVTLPMGG